MQGETSTTGLIERILQLSDRAFRELLPIVPKEWLRLDLTMPQLKVAVYLFINQSSRMSELASALDVSLATATGVVDRLVEKGLVVRESDPEDRRVVRCHLSEKGESLIGGLWKLARDRVGELLRALDTPDLVKTEELLKALLKAGELTRRDLEESRQIRTG